MRSNHLARRRQQAGLSLWGVAFGSMLLALVAVGLLFSMRYDKNMFFVAWDKLVGSQQTAAALQGSKDALAEAQSTGSGKPLAPKLDGRMQKCTINGKTVYSDSACGNQGQSLKINDSRGVEAPKVPAKADSAPQSAMDAAIEKATR